MTARESMTAGWQRIKGGDTGILPVLAGLVLVSILFQTQNENFLTVANLVNLLVQAAVFSLLAMGQIYALLLGDIDLSVGYVAGLTAVVMATLAKPSGASVALVGRYRDGPVGGLPDRSAAGQPDHAAGAAVVRRDAGRPVVLAGRDAARARQWRVDPHPGRDDHQHRQRRTSARRLAGS